MVQEVRGPRTVPLGAKADEPLQTKKIETKEHGKKIGKNYPQTRRREGCQTETQKRGKWREKKEESPGKGERFGGRNLKLEVSGSEQPQVLSVTTGVEWSGWWDHTDVRVT